MYYTSQTCIVVVVGAQLPAQIILYRYILLLLNIIYRPQTTYFRRYCALGISNMQVYNMLLRRGTYLGCVINRHRRCGREFYRNVITTAPVYYTHV